MEIRAEAERWLRAEPDDDLRDELRELIDGPRAELEQRFGGHLEFGTAGLRAAVGAGPLRMNRLVVRQAAAGLAAWLKLQAKQGAIQSGPVIVGYDARRKSDLFAVDTARVMAAAGFDVLIFDQVVPTPVLAWNIRQFACCAGVMVTASHNPPADNGYKVYLGSGSQIVSPVDQQIAAQIQQIHPWNVDMADEDDERIRWIGAKEIDQYVQAAAQTVLRQTAGVPVAYTAMHGVGGQVFVDVCAALGYPRPSVVAQQQQPDGTFPTVTFPNPEEPGAMDLVLALANETGSALAIANDPDADRLGAAIPLRSGGWRLLGGDEIGWLLADHILANTADDYIRDLSRQGVAGYATEQRLVVTTLVSSSLLGRIAANYGVHYQETFTGFKWIARVALSHPELRFVFGYEQALGYLVTDRPLDKDGITAATMLIEAAVTLAERGETLEDRLNQLADQYGRYTIYDTSVKMAPAAGARAVAALRASLPTKIGGQAVTDSTWYAEAGLLRVQLGDNLRIQVRPSGTEPKVKLYGEGVDADPRSAVDAMAQLLRDAAAWMRGRVDAADD